MGTTTAPSGFGRPIWTAMKHGQQVHGVGLVPVVFTFNLDNTAAGPYATTYTPVMTVGSFSSHGMWKLEAASLVMDANVNTGSGSNGGSIDIVIGSGATFNDTHYPIVSGTQYVTTASASAATGTLVDLNVLGPESHTPKNVFMAAGDTVSIKQEEEGSGHDNSGVLCTVTLLFRHSPPGR